MRGAEASLAEGDDARRSGPPIRAEPIASARFATTQAVMASPGM